MKMARSGSSHLKDIDEKFCQCPICLQQYREPKQLPCLHRYCSDCLKQLIERNQATKVVTCPECRADFPVPSEGVDGFKTDFYMKNIIEYIQIQKSLEPQPLRECFDCSKEVKVTAYCFKCNGFLCKDCHENHMIKRSLKDHKQHTLSLQELKSEHMTFEKLADLKEAPRCKNHLKDLCLLCCRTCNDRPICVTCTYGSHRNHDINDVGIIAAEEREKLTKDLRSLSEHYERIQKMPQTVERLKEELTLKNREMKENFSRRYEKNMKTLRKEIETIEGHFKHSQTEIENSEKAELMESRKQMDLEMNQVKVKFDKIFKKIKENSQVKLGNLKQKQAKDLQESREKSAVLEEEFQSSMKVLETRQEEVLQKLKEILQHVDDVKKRYENLTTTGYSVLETRNDWTAVQCIPDICKAVKPLSEYTKKEFPQLDTLSKIGISFGMVEHEKSPVNIEGLQTGHWSMTGITGSVAGSIFLSGPTSVNCQSHISVINMKGQLLHLKEFKSTFVRPFRFCACISDFKVATTCPPYEIGVFDIQDHSYIKKDIRKAVRRLGVDRRIRCVTTDPVTKHILVGGYGSRYVYVFDDQLNFQHTLTLPKMIKNAGEMTIIEGHLLVCDRRGKEAYLVKMEKLEGKLAHKFTKPDIDGEVWTPISLCTDANGFIYILWMTGKNYNSGGRLITQYTQDGRRFLTATRIDISAAICITTILTGVTEKLLVATSKTFHVYSVG